MLMRIIEFMMRSGFSIGQIVAHLTYHTTLTTIQGSELLVNLTMNSLVTSYDIATAKMNMFNTNVSEEVVLNTTLQCNGEVNLSNSSPPISVNSSPPITVSSSSTHTVNSSSSEENANYEIARQPTCLFLLMLKVKMNKSNRQAVVKNPDNIDNYSVVIMNRYFNKIDLREYHFNIIR